MMLERGLHVDHTTIYRWVQRSAPELDKRCRPHLKSTNDSWRVDETYGKVKKVWMDLYRAVDSEGNTLEFLLSATRDAEAAKRFFVKALHATAGSAPQAHPVQEQVVQQSTPADPKTTMLVPVLALGTSVQKIVSSRTISHVSTACRSCSSFSDPCNSSLMRGSF
jgi:transposase, IS6 family